MAYQKFSVAMSVYKNDNPAFFTRAIESITSEQTIPPDEIILIVDGPIGQTLDNAICAAAQAHLALRVIRLRQNGGLGNALRLAVESASYDLIARMDSDDISSPDRFERQLQTFADNPDLDIVGGDITEFVGEESNIVATRVVPRTHAEILDYMRTRCPLNHVSVMYRKEAVLRCGNYLDLFWNEDYYLWIRMAQAGCIMENIDGVAVNVRTGEDMYRRRGGIRYFKSELFLQRLLRKNKMIGFFTFHSNVCKRLIVQVLLPNKIRGWVFRKFARKKA